MSTSVRPGRGGVDRTLDWWYRLPLTEFGRALVQTQLDEAGSAR
ncbi:hypothetical protein [Mycolicibacterium bacteremicum]|nr:hypothetical protein [Mycolicibacterium bacteremicum]